MKIANFGVEEWLNVWENDAIYDIAGSSIASFTLEEIIKTGNKSEKEFFSGLMTKKMNYGWIEGSPEFKEQVSLLYKNIKPEQVLQTNGATGGNFLALYSLIEAGDHVISLYPTYQQLYDIPRSFGAEVDLWHIKEENGWLPDLEELRKLVRSNTKMICINNANNPTGAVMEEDFLKELVKIAESCGAYILSDSDKIPEFIFIATGSELELAEEAAKVLRGEGKAVRVVSMPSMDVFAMQSAEYQEEILPSSVEKRISVEALSSFGWGKYVGLKGKTLSLDSFGASGPAKELFKHFGFTVENLLAMARSM